MKVDCNFSHQDMCVFRVLHARIFLYSVQMRENTDQKNSEYGLFSRSFEARHISF